jgi:TRAP-type mannitol/chloroaromatic compound transport system substrate-binding protein
MKKLSRKSFFKGLALGTISLPFVIRSCGSKNIAQTSSTNLRSTKTYKWKMTTTWPPDFPGLGEGCKLFAKLVNEMSSGRMHIQVFGAGELVPALEAFNTVRSGAAEIGHGCGYYWKGMVPAAQFFASIPFGMNAQQMNAWLISGGGMQLWKKVYGEYNLVPFPGGNSGVQMGGWFNKEINTIEDFKGLKMRIPGMGSTVLKKAGGAPVLLPGGEIYTGLERGVIDATEWLGPYHDFKMGFHQIAKYYYTPGWHEPGTSLEFFINKQKFDELEPGLQEIIRTAAYRVNHWMLCEFEAKNALFLEKLIDEKVDIRKFPDEVLAKLRELTDEALAEEIADDPLSKEVYASYDNFRKKAAAWGKITEKVFYNSIQI